MQKNSDQPEEFKFPVVPQRDWDVVVIGAGVLGAFHAYFARLKGLRTLLIERSYLPLDASVRNFGMIAAGGMSPGVWHSRGVESANLYRTLAEQLSFDLTTYGSQYLATTPTEANVLREFASLAPSKGYHCKLLDAQESVFLNPVVRREICLASVHFPDDVRLNPRKFLREFIPWMTRETGVAYSPRTVAVQVSQDGSHCHVLTADGTEHRASHVFVCSGADLVSLFPQKFAENNLLQCKLHMLKTVPQSRLRVTASLASGLTLRRYLAFRICPSWSKLRDEHVEPELLRRGIHILMVQDADGGVVVGDSHEYARHGLDERLDSVTEELILAEAQRLTHLDHWEIATRWHGIYSLHPERELFTETIAERIHLATGIGGKGMTTGPAVARESIDSIA